MDAITLTITYNQTTGALNCEGTALSNKMLAYAMLELAKDAVREHYAKLSERKVQPVNLALPPGFDPSRS